MKHYLILAVALALVSLPGCKPSHPSAVTIDPDFDANAVKTILVAPCVSSVTEGEDPDRESERLIDKILRDLVDQRADYVFYTQQQFLSAVNNARVQEEYERFKASWIKTREIDATFFNKLKSVFDADLVLVPSVYLWYKDEADYREAGTASTTQVGATLTLIDPSAGTVVWEATDENYKEAVRTEGSREQSIYGGITRRVEGVTETGRDMYSAPPFEDVALLVLEALVTAIPERGLTGE
jgi:hypothetical protein